MLSFRWWFMELFFVCADLLRWVPIFLHTVYSVQFCLHRCRSSPMLSYVFKMLSVDWYVRNRIKHVHPVSDGNSRCRLGAARHSTTSRVSPAQSASRVTVRHGMNVPDSLYPHCHGLAFIRHIPERSKDIYDARNWNKTRGEYTMNI